LNLLIVDDYPSNRKLLRAALEAEGHGVVEATNGREALRMLEQELADAVISDVLMPTMDGFRLCQEIRKRATLSGMPLILYTSTYNSPSDRELARSVGADAYILKPAPVGVLLNAVGEAQRQARTRTAPRVPEFDDTEVLERYNAALVRKLESRNTELQQTLASLRSAHENILDLNRNLETRVIQRTSSLDAANRELEAFSYSVSHDLRTPLRHIAAFAQMLEQSSMDRLDENGRNCLRQITTSAAQMDKLIHELLEFARCARSALTLVPLELEPVLDEALAAIAPDAAGRNIEWHRTVLPRVHGDAGLLRQVLVNLLSNAIKYTRTRPAARIEIGHREGRADEAVIFVRDNGVGFDSRRAGELFGVFKRLHSAKEFEGTGVGLAHAHRIISRHGGSMWAEAAVDRGATFYFGLRRAAAN
jgi:signal transduction histidine kinase